jgi:hypothetical protein
MASPYRARSFWHGLIITLFLSLVLVILTFSSIRYGREALRQRWPAATASDPTQPAFAVQIPQVGYWSWAQPALRLRVTQRPHWASLAYWLARSSVLAPPRYYLVFIGPNPADGPAQVLTTWEFEAQADFEIALQRPHYAIYHADYTWRSIYSAEQLAALPVPLPLGRWQPTPTP